MKRRGFGVVEVLLIVAVVVAIGFVGYQVYNGRLANREPSNVEELSSSIPSQVPEVKAAKDLAEVDASLDRLDFDALLDESDKFETDASLP